MYYSNLSQLGFTRTTPAETGRPGYPPQALCNVMGVWRGQSGEEALVISAHFDHVGRYGGAVYSGALDNVSGVAVMLEILRQTAACRPQPAYDIIFCAFNGVDMGQLGSRAFSDLPLRYERMNVINLDTIGWSASGVLAINAGEEALAGQVADVLREAGFACDIGEFGRSDHNMLCGNGIPAITLASGGDVASVIHSAADQAQGVDFGQLLQIGTALRQSIGGFQLVDQVELSDLDIDQLAAIQTAQAEKMVEQYQPGGDEMVIYQTDDFWSCARSTSPIDTLEEVFERYPNAYLPSALGPYQFESFHPSGFPTRDADAFSVAHSFYALEGDSIAQGLMEGVYPVEELLFPDFQSVRYCDAQVKSIDVVIYPLDQWQSRREENAGSGQMYFLGTQELTVSSQPPRVTCLCSTTSSAISLTSPVDAAGTGAAVGLEELKALMEQELSEIQRIVYLK